MTRAGLEGRPSEFWSRSSSSSQCSLDTLPPIILGVIISLLLLIYHTSFPTTSELRRDPTTGMLESSENRDDTEPIPAMVVYRFDAPLIFANAAAFTDNAYALVDAADPPARILVGDCEEVAGIDYTGVQALEGLVEDMRTRGVDVRWHARSTRRHRRLERRACERSANSNIFPVRARAVLRSMPETTHQCPAGAECG